MADDEWVVVLEVASDADDPGMALTAVRDLIQAVSDCRPAALHCPDRYALQLRVPADGPADALLRAVSRWEDAAGRKTVTSCSLASIEVLTADEFRRQVDAEMEPPDTTLPVAGVSADGFGDDVLWRAFSDSLTNLASRGLFLHRVEHAVARARSTKTRVAVLVIDIEDSVGPTGPSDVAEADEVLATVAARLGSLLRVHDTAARIGDNRLAVLLPAVPSVDAATVVAHRVATAIERPVNRRDGDVVVTSSVGLAVTDGTYFSADLMAEASEAAKAAKRSESGHRFALRSLERVGGGDSSRSAWVP